VPDATDLPAGSAGPSGHISRDDVAHLARLARLAVSDDELDTFAGQPLLTIHYSPTGPAPTSIFYLDPQGNAIAVPSTVDPVAHTISATLPHFSDWVTGDLVDVALNASAATIDPGASVTLTATVTNQSDSSASPNAPVVFHTTLGTLGPASCSTDGSGVCGVTLTNGSDQGLAAVTAEVEGTFSSAVLVTFRQPINHTLTGAHVHAVELNADATHVTVTIDGVAEMPLPMVNAAFDGLYAPGDQWYWRADFVNEIPDEAVELNAEWGEEIKAVVELLPGKRGDDDQVRAELMAFLQGRIARYKLPKSIDFIDALPRDPNGKLYKRRLRDPYWAGEHRAI